MYERKAPWPKGTLCIADWTCRLGKPSGRHWFCMQPPVNKVWLPSPKGPNCIQWTRHHAMTSCWSICWSDDISGRLWCVTTANLSCSHICARWRCHHLSRFAICNIPKWFGILQCWYNITLTSFSPCNYGCCSNVILDHDSDYQIAGNHYCLISIWSCHAIHSTKLPVCLNQAW